MREARSLVDREAQLAAVAAVLHEARAARGGLLLVEGEVGAGKTSVLAAGRAMGADMMVLSARGGELEGGLAFGVCRQLFEPVARARPDLLTGSAALATAALELGSAAPRRAFEVEHGLYWLLDGMAATAGVLLCVDDLHWSDTASLRWLLYLARRLDGLPVAVLVGLRTGEPVADAAALEALRAEPAVRAVDLPPLPSAATAVLVRTALGAETDDEACARCHRLSGGNPFLLTQLVAAVAAGEPLEAGPAGVAASVRHRLARLPAAATVLAEAVAVLDVDAEPRVAAAVAGLPVGTALDAAAVLQRVRLFAASARLGFAHPVLRAAVYGELMPARRAALHAAAARVLAADPPTVDRAAVHLLDAPPTADPAAVACLRAAAARAAGRGAPDVAADLLARAVDEPPDRDVEAAVLLELGSAELAAGRDGAADHLDRALALARGVEMRVRSAHALALALAHADPERALGVLQREVDALRPVDPERALAVEADLFMLGASALWVGRRLLPRLRERVAGVGGRTPAERVLLAARVAYQVVEPDLPAHALTDLCVAAWGVGRLPAEQGPLAPAVGWIIISLGRLDQVDLAERYAGQAVGLAHQAGNLAAAALIATHQADLALMRGRLRDAEALARTALEHPAFEVFAVHRLFGLSVLVDALTARGQLDDAEQALEQDRLSSTDLTGTTPTLLLLLARARLRLARGEFATASADMTTFLGRAGEQGIGMRSEARLLAAQTYLLVGDRRRAEELIDEDVDSGRRFEGPSALGCALRAKAVLVGGAAGIALLEESVAVLDPSPRRLELARSLVELGSAMRREHRPRAGREPLQRGMEIASDCAAAPLVRRAYEELLATGARPRRVASTGLDALTPAERRVAALAAEGRSNPEIAQALFVTRKTVEAHLGAVFRKLGVTSRAALADLPALNIGVAPR